MDVVRRRRGKNPARIVLPAAILALLAGAAYSGFTLMRPPADLPIIERAAIMTDTAVRGELVRSVRAPGTLVAQRVRVADASLDGRVDDILVRVGSSVDARTTIARMSDPDLDAAVVDARAQIVAAQAELRSVREEARASQLDRASTVSAAIGDYRQRRADAARYRTLHAGGLVSDYDFTIAQIKSDEARDSIAFDRRKITVDAADAQAKIAVARARVAQLEAALAAKEARRDALVVRAGTSGVVASIAVERGARVAAGTQIARIVGQRDLKAMLAVPESDIRDVAPGLPTTVDTGNGIIHGHVARIDPAAQNGAIAVDVTIDGTLPPNARPDLHVDGTIDIERLHNVISIARPANAADDVTIAVYRLVDGGNRAVRTPIRVGHGSLERVRVLSGLVPGATIITSDTSAFTAAALRVQ